MAKTATASKAAKTNTAKQLLALAVEISTINDVDAIIDKVQAQLNCSLAAEASDSGLSLPLKLKDTICAYFVFKRPSQELEDLNLFMDLVSQRVEQLQLTMDLSASNERLLEQSQYMSQIFSTVSHELRTPLTNVIGFSELMLERELEPAITKQYLNEISRSGKRLATLINDFLDLSRVESNGDIKLAELEEASIDWLAERAWKDISTELMFGRSNAEIEWQIAKKLPQLMLDSDAMIRVFINLFSNALKYGAGSKIICRMEVLPSKKIQVTVEDKGIGIPADMLDSVFERFTRIDNGVTRETGGTGLGLWICRQIIEAHGGTIWCESELDKGTRIKITL